MRILKITVLCLLVLSTQAFGQQGGATGSVLESNDQFVTYYNPSGFHLAIQFEDKTSVTLDVPAGVFLEVKALLSENPEQAEFYKRMQEKGKNLDLLRGPASSAENPTQTYRGNIQIRLKHRDLDKDENVPMSDVMASAPFALGLQRAVLTIQKQE